MTEQGDPGVRGGVDVLFHPADLRFHVGAEKIGTGGVDGDGKSQLSGVLGELAAQGESLVV